MRPKKTPSVESDGEDIDDTEYNPGPERLKPWRAVEDDYRQVLDWICPACQTLIHATSSGRAICPRCGRSAMEAVPRDKPARDPGDPAMRRFLKSVKF